VEHSAWRAKGAAAFAAAILLSATPPATASDAEFHVGGEYVLLQDKVVVGPQFGLRYGGIGLDIEFLPGFATSEASQADLDGDSFFGFLAGFHLVGVPFEVGEAEIELGTGLDIWWLSAIHEEEAKMAWPIMVGARTGFGRLTAGLQARYYLLTAGGLLAGEGHDGEDGIPIIVSATLGGRW
jgi:hypothetical protein